MLFVRERETLPEIDPAVPTALIYYREARRRARQQGARVPFAKEDTFRKKAGDQQKDKNQKSTPLGVEPQHSKDNSNSDNHPFLFLAERSKTPQDPKLKERAQCQF